LSKIASASANGARRQPTRWTRKRLLLALGVIFVGGIVAAVLDLRFQFGGTPRRVEPNSVLLLSPTTMATVANPTRAGFAAPTVVRSPGLVWTVDSARDRLTATNTVTNRVFRTEVVGNSPVAVAIGFGAAWVANAGNGTITRVPLAGDKIETIGLSDQPSAIATGAGYVWVASAPSKKVIRIDPKTKQVDKTIQLANPPLAVAVRSPERVTVAIGH
jgi:streptogramin lyase